MLDSERALVLPQMAAGLSSILFAIKIDNEALNDINSFDETKNNDLEAVAAASTVIPKNSKKKKKGSAQVISFDEEEIKAKLLLSGTFRNFMTVDYFSNFQYNIQCCSLGYEIINYSLISANKDSTVINHHNSYDYTITNNKKSPIQERIASPRYV